VAPVNAAFGMTSLIDTSPKPESWAISPPAPSRRLPAGQVVVALLLDESKAPVALVSRWRPVTAAEALPPEPVTTTSARPSTKPERRRPALALGMAPAMETTV
jgi:hypothetical protein